MSRKLRSSKSTRATKRTKRRVMRKTSVRKAKKVVKKKGSRKKSKKSIVRKRKTSNNKNYMIMKGGVLEIMCGTKKIKIKNQGLINLLNHNFPDKFKSDGDITDLKSASIKMLDKNKNNYICELGPDKSREKQEYRMHYSSGNKELYEDENYICIQNNLSENQKKSVVKYVPNILHFEKNKNNVVMIEEHFTEIPPLIDTNDEYILDLLIKMAKCVEFLHSNNIVHSRIYFKKFKKNRNNNIIITDFSRSFNFSHYRYVTDVVYLEYDSATFENIGYDTAPEVLSQEHYYDNRELLKKRDVFSFGIMLREILKLDNNMTDKLKLALNEIKGNCTEANPIERNTFTAIIKLLEQKKSELELERGELSL